MSRARAKRYAKTVHKEGGLFFKNNTNSMKAQNCTDILVSQDKNKSPRLKGGFENIIIGIDGVVCEDIPNEQPERMPKARGIEGSKRRSMNGLQRAI